MAKLTIKNLPDDLYRRLQPRARMHERSTDQEVVQILTDALEPVSILTLEGLGKDVWDDVVPERCIDEERKTWDP